MPALRLRLRGYRAAAIMSGILVLLALAHAGAFAGDRESQSEPAAQAQPVPAERVLAQSKAVVSPVESAETPPKAKPAQSARKPGTETTRVQWREQLRRELDACRELGFFKRAFCMDKAKFKHCYPARWDTVPECASTHAPQRGAPGN